MANKSMKWVFIALIFLDPLKDLLGWIVVCIKKTIEYRQAVKKMSRRKLERTFMKLLARRKYYD